MTEIIFVVEDAPEGGFFARALGYSIFTAADSAPLLQAMLEDAVARHFDEGRGPKVIRLRPVRGDVIQA